MNYCEAIKALYEGKKITNGSRTIWIQHIADGVIPVLICKYADGSTHIYQTLVPIDLDATYELVEDDE